MKSASSHLPVASARPAGYVSLRGLAEVLTAENDDQIRARVDAGQVKASLRPDEVAQVLSCSERQVQYLVAEGRIRAFDICRRAPNSPEHQRQALRIPTVALARFVRESMVGA